MMKGKQRDPARINCQRDQKGRAFMAFKPVLTVDVDRAKDVLDRRVGILVHGLFFQSYHGDGPDWRNGLGRELCRGPA